MKRARSKEAAPAKRAPPRTRPIPIPRSTNLWSHFLVQDTERVIFRFLVHNQKERHLMDVPNVLSSAGLVSKHWRTQLLEVLRHEVAALLDSTATAFADLSPQNLRIMHQAKDDVEAFRKAIQVSPMVLLELGLLPPIEPGPIGHLINIYETEKEAVGSAVGKVPISLVLLFLVNRSDDVTFWHEVAKKSMPGVISNTRTKYYMARKTSSELHYVLGTCIWDKFYRLFPTLAAFDEAEMVATTYRIGQVPQVDDAHSKVHFRACDVFYTRAEHKTDYFHWLKYRYPFKHRMALIQPLLDALDPAKRYRKLVNKLKAAKERIDQGIYAALCDTMSINEACANREIELISMKHITDKIIALEKEVGEYDRRSDPFARAEWNPIPGLPLYTYVIDV